MELRKGFNGRKTIKIESLRLRNFKAFQDVKLEDIPGLCIVVGANGSGKTTLFDVFGFLKDCLIHSVQSAAQKRGGFKDGQSRPSGGRYPD